VQVALQLTDASEKEVGWYYVQRRKGGCANTVLLWKKRCWKVSNLY